MGKKTISDYPSSSNPNEDWYVFMAKEDGCYVKVKLSDLPGGKTTTSTTTTVAISTTTSTTTSSTSSTTTQYVGETSWLEGNLFS